MSYRGARSYLQSTQAISPLPFHLFHIINKQIDPGVIAKKLKTHFQNKKKGRLVRMLTRVGVGGGGTLMKEDIQFPGIFFTPQSFVTWCNPDLHERLRGD